MNQPLVLNFTNDFEKAAYFERLAFSNFIRKHNLWLSKEYEIRITPYTGTEAYDVLVIKYNSQGTMVGKLIIELKIRDTDFSDAGWVFESKKYKSLTAVKQMDPALNKLLYINFTPAGTLVWDLDSIMNKYEVESKEMNKATMSSRGNKVNKSIYLLQNKDAKIYSYTWSINQYNKMVQENKKVELDKHITKDLIDWLNKLS